VTDVDGFTNAGFQPAVDYVAAVPAIPATLSTLFVPAVEEVLAAPADDSLAAFRLATCAGKDEPACSATAGCQYDAGPPGQCSEQHKGVVSIE
jgi:hypothetical protein